MQFSGSSSPVVHVVQWFIHFSGSCSSVVQWFTLFCGSSSSVVHAVQLFASSCSSVVHAVQWFMQLGASYVHAVGCFICSCVQWFIDPELVVHTVQWVILIGSCRGSSIQSQLFSAWFMKFNGSCIHQYFIQCSAAIHFRG